MSKYSIQNDSEIQQRMENERIEYLLKSQSIEFGIFLSNNITFEDFCFMSKGKQEEIYQLFLKTPNQYKL
jgi:hypothetical protein